MHSGLRARDCPVSRRILANMQTTDCKDIVTGRRSDIPDTVRLIWRGDIVRSETALSGEDDLVSGKSLSGLSLSQGDSPALESEPEPPSDSDPASDPEPEGLTGHELKLTSVFQKLGSAEPILTNWNGEFRA